MGGRPGIGAVNFPGRTGATAVLQGETVAKKGKKEKGDPGELLVCRNPKASQRFEIEERLEAGLVLVGSEVKSLRDKRGDLDASYVAVRQGELWLLNMHIAPYTHASTFGHDARRSRKLLVHKHQIKRLEGRLTMRGYALVPIRVYFKNGRAKIELGLGKGKKTVDRREDLKRQADLREAREAVQRRRG